MFLRYGFIIELRVAQVPGDPPQVIADSPQPSKCVEPRDRLLIVDLSVHHGFRKLTPIFLLIAFEFIRKVLGRLLIFFYDVAFDRREDPVNLTSDTLDVGIKNGYFMGRFEPIEFIAASGQTAKMVHDQQ